MIVRLALRITPNANYFPLLDGISKYFGPATIISSRQINYKTDLVFSFGDYVQGYVEIKFKNNNVPRTKDCIYHQPTEPLQRGHECMDLMTGELICCPKVDLCVMTRLVIARVEELAASQGYRTLKFLTEKSSR